MSLQKVRLVALTFGILLSIPSSAALSQVSDAPGAREAKIAELLSVRVQSRIDARQKNLGSEAKIGVIVSDADTGTILFAHNENEPFAIASNAKIITTAAALALLGPAFRFRTELLAEPVATNGHITGDLYIRGRGNPFFSESDMARLVRGLKAQGVKRIDGGIIVDNSYFDEVNLPQHFDEQPDEHASFRAPIAATSLSFNAWTLLVRPALAGTGPARIEVTPANDYVKVASTVKTIKTGRSLIRMNTEAEKTHLQITLSGQIRQEVRRRRFRKRVPDPVLFVGSGLRRALADAAIGVSRSQIKMGPAPASAVPLAIHESPPLAVVVRGMGKYSSNFIAELVLKVIGAETMAGGAPATWQHGVDAVHGVLAKAGLADGSFRYENGSGLFDSNRFSPAQILKVLTFAMKDYRWGPDLLASFSISATDGTLRGRMEGTPGAGRVRAKTGTLAQASALSGVAAMDGNSPLLFSILINGFPESSTSIARALQDEIAAELVRSLSP
jgi:D-alanyl-D-alanine carboxypeptidase/D-alanyl-D-alanine-endopeptidase (penicillin-binding protein 4)